ncbi:MAG: winged helix-turn-helix transcriptional regulator [Planctomycetota bacterium]|jgi:DNA-binding HxlR family transcriptional regulator
MGALSLVPGGSRSTPSITARDSSPVPIKGPVEVTLDALEGRYRPLIVWHLFWGARPFSELMRHTPGITKKTLRQELAEMERLGLVRREVRLGRTRKAEYSLTPLGQTLKPLVAAMYEWGLHRLRAPARLRNCTAGAGIEKQ